MVRNPIRLIGIPASRGVAEGPVTVVGRRGQTIPYVHISPDHIDLEVQRLRDAIDASRDEINAVRSSLGALEGTDYGLILDAHLLMHRDELLIHAAVAGIRDQLVNAEWALRRAIDELKRPLIAASDPYFRERAEDVEHVGQHILRHLVGDRDLFEAFENPSIVVASNLSPADAIQLFQNEVRGLVMSIGSTTSHTAILARTWEIPAVFGVADIFQHVAPDDVVIVDGLRGGVIVHPAEEERHDARNRGTRYRSFKGKLRDEEDVDRCVTADGHPITLMANLELPVEATFAVLSGAAGIGLYRTEFLFVDRKEAPSEQEQYQVYADVVRVMRPRPVVFRTFDLGGDKLAAPGDSIPPAPNPALGLRAIRLLLTRPDLLRDQIRAVLRAAVLGPAKLMLPLVTSVTELRAAKDLVRACRHDLDQEGVATGDLPIGVMIEAPAAVLVADVLAKEAAFLSVGTNDLVQYALALDRGNPMVAHMAVAFDPAVIRLLAMVVRAAEAATVPLSMCGDMAADLFAIPLVLGLGFTELSVPVGYLPLMRAAIRRIDRALAIGVAKEALQLADASTIAALVTQRFSHELGDLWAEHGIH